MKGAPMQFRAINRINAAERILRLCVCGVTADRHALVHMGAIYYQLDNFAILAKVVESF